MEGDKGEFVYCLKAKHGALYMVEVCKYKVNDAIEKTGASTLWHQRLGYNNVNENEDVILQREDFKITNYDNGLI